MLYRHLRGDPFALDGLFPDQAAHRERLDKIKRALPASANIEISQAEAFLGGGSAPGRGVTGAVLALPGDQALFERLRTGTPSVVGYLKESRLVLDLRTINPADDESLCGALQVALS